MSVAIICTYYKYHINAETSDEEEIMIQWMPSRGHELQYQEVFVET